MEPINEMESVNAEMKKVIARTQGRSDQFLDILDAVDSTQFKTNVWNDIDSYRSSLQDFLSIYGDTCRQNITVFKKDDNAFFKQELRTMLGVELTDTELKVIEDSNVLHIDANTVLIPFIQRVYPVVISIDSEKDVLDIDPDHIISLSTIHSWMKKP